MASIFINAPFDDEYRELFRAIVFTSVLCGHVPHCALEVDDATRPRLDRILGLIGRCDLGIHDLSRTALDAAHRLPRFNMPLELGLFLGAKRFGGPRQKRKRCLVLDSEPHRYQRFCSDIAGQDVRAHGNTIGGAIRAVRDWLQATAGRSATLPGGAAIEKAYAAFTLALPHACAARSLDPGELTFLDHLDIARAWKRITAGRRGSERGAGRGGAA